MNKPLRIIFMGTPDFAVPSLHAINESDHEICAIVTTPDRPAGRGRKIQYSAVKKYALEYEIPIEQPVRLRDEQFLASLDEYEADLYIVIAFRMLPALVWKKAKLGTVNLHASLLPQYRGAAPINWAIINGESESGLTTFFIDEKIDEGAIILSQKLLIGSTENASSLHDRLMVAGADLIIQTIDLIESEKYQVITQSNILESELKAAPKLFKSDCIINWELEGNSIFNHIRGLSYYPGAYTLIEIRGKQKQIKIFTAEFKTEKHKLQNGIMFTDEKSFLKFSCSGGFIYCHEVQIEGKKRMNITDFLNGTHF